MDAAEIITEADLLATILETAPLYGWLVYHVLATKPPAKVTSTGFPDLVLLRGADLIFVELKGPKGKQTPEQIDWLDRLGIAVRGPHQRAQVWRPADLDRIMAILTEVSTNAN